MNNSKNKKNSLLMFWPINYTFLLIVIGCIHRAIIFGNIFPDLQELISQNPHWLTWQYLTIQSLTKYLPESILYLQQTPPIPNVILGLVAKTSGWPYGTAYVLIIFQAILSIGTTLLLFYFLNIITKRQRLNFFISLVFLLSTDLVVMEYNSFGQTFYENLAMFLLLLAIYFFYKLLNEGKIVYSVSLGLITGILALCRASFSYFFVIPTIFLLFIVIIRRFRARKVLLPFFICLLLTQGIWVAKNYIIYKTATMSTSSWKGINFAIGLVRVGEEDVFIQSIVDRKDHYPSWFIEMIQKHGLVHWNPPHFKAYIPQYVRQQEEHIQSILHNTNRSENSIGQRMVSDLYMKAYISFFFNNPSIIIKKFIKSYRLFWQPIRNYSYMYLGPLYIEPKVTDSFNIGRMVKSIFTEGICDNQYLMKGTWRDKIKKETCFYTIPYLPGLILLVNIVVINVAVLLLFLYAIIYLLKYKRSLLQLNCNKSVLLLFFLGCYLYACVVMNLPEYGENMRFRLSVEPVIWLISISSIMIIVYFVPFILGIKSLPSKVLL